MQVTRHLILLTAFLLPLGCGSVADIDPIACTADAKMCPDGTGVGRNPGLNCEFDPCPQLQTCGAGQPCAGEYECYDFLNDEVGAYCYVGDPCQKCASGQCDLIESLPKQVECTE